jgi:uncharacterized phage infection (PIP) family protein YhgE
MRRCVFTAMGVLEAAVALVLLGFAWYLPGPSDVHDKVDRVEKVSKQSSKQVGHLRAQVHGLRERQPVVRDLAQRMDQHTKEITGNLRDQQLDYDTVRTVSDSLGDVAAGLDGLSQALDPKGVQDTARGFGAAADYLDDNLAPGADRAAKQLEKSTEALRADAVRLAALLREAPLDLKSAREMNESLGKLSKGLEQMTTSLKADHLDTMRDGFDGLETSLATGAEQVERLATYTYPVVAFSGLKPTVESRPFWPEGGRIADGMRRAGRGARAAAKEVDRLRDDLPRLKASLEESRKVVDKTHEALTAALKKQAAVEPLLRDVPEHAARLAEELPLLGGDLAKLLRDTGRLREVAAMLRDAQKNLDRAVAQWPEMRKNLGRSSELLRAMQKQVRHALEHRAEYEASLEQTLVLIRTFAAVLPLLTEELEDELQQQERSLANLGTSIDEVSAALPACEQTATRILTMSRLLMVLVAGIFALHGAYLCLGSRLGPAYSV